MPPGLPDFVCLTDGNFPHTLYRGNVLEKEAQETICELNAPLIYSFSKYVLETAQKRGLKRVYFLARDGYEPYLFAKRLARVYHYSVECRYLFSSRLAWRLACYARLSEKEISGLIFSPSLFLTPDMILERIRATPQEKEELLVETGLCRNDLLTACQCRNLQKKLEKDIRFWNIVRKNSDKALDITLKYFRQEGLMDNDFAICDSGWSGSMQKCLELILGTRGSRHKVYGIYFGLYACPKELISRVSAYYFLPDRKFFRKAKFNNNLLEAMFVSPHGMTIGYKEKNGKILPVLKEDKAEWFRQDHLYLQKKLEEYLETETDADETEVKKRLAETMYKPMREQLICFSRYRFSDDPSEQKRDSIVRKLTKEEARKFLVFKRLQTKLSKEKRAPLPNVYWLYGSIEASDLKHKYWYRWNCLFWEMMRLVRIRCRSDR